MTSIDMTHQGFRDTAATRIAEAEHMLERPTPRKDRFDGAVTCALLAVECALKALVLQVHQKRRVSELPESVQVKLFRSKNGHNIAMLDQELDPVSTKATSPVKSAIAELHKLDRYGYRYGATRPAREHARPLVANAREVVDWMKGLSA